MKKAWLIGCGTPLLVLGIAIYFGAKALKPQPKPERSETVMRGDVEIKVIETGTIEPLTKVEVKSKAGGRVINLLVDEGARVQRGQKIAIIEAEEVNSQVAALEAQLAGARARWASAQKGMTYQEAQTAAGIAQFRQAVESAKARLQSAEVEAKVQPELTRKAIEIAQANLDAAKANLRVQQDSLKLLQESTHPQAVVNAQAAYDRAKAQRDNAARNLQRQEQLLQKGFVSQQAVDTAKTDLSVSDTQVREAKQRLDRIDQTDALEAANAQSQIASAVSQVRQMEAALEQAQANVLPETKRQERDNARAALAQARAQLASAQSSVTQNRMRVDDAAAAKAQVDQIQKQLDEVRVRQQDTTLYAPMSGLVTKRYVEKGEMITSAVSAFGSGTPVYQISDLEVMLVKINVNEVDIAKLKPGTKTEVTIDAAKGIIFHGKVRKVSPAAVGSANSSSSGSSSTSGNTSSAQTVIRFLVEIQIDKPDPRLKPGMSARCSVIVARQQNVLRLPSNCVEGTGENGTVQIVTTTTKDGKQVETTAPRQVKVGLRGDDFVEVLSGLNEGERVRPGKYTGPTRKTIEMRGGPGD